MINEFYTRTNSKIIVLMLEDRHYHGVPVAENAGPENVAPNCKTGKHENRLVMES